MNHFLKPSAFAIRSDKNAINIMDGKPYLAITQEENTISLSFEEWEFVAEAVARLKAEWVSGQSALLGATNETTD